MGSWGEETEVFFFHLSSALPLEKEIQIVPSATLGVCICVVYNEQALAVTNNKRFEYRSTISLQNEIVMTQLAKKFHSTCLDILQMQTRC